MKDKNQKLVDLKDFAFNFYRSDAEILFDEVRSLAKPRFEVPEHLEKRVEEYLSIIEQYCVFDFEDSNSRLYRARKHEYGQLVNFTGKDLGAPKSDYTTFGRAQMAGTSVLYLANTPETSIAEVKPDAGELVSVGVFKLVADIKLKLVDFTRLSLPSDPMVLYQKMSSGAISKDLPKIADLSLKAFSGPVHPKDPKAYFAHAFWVQLFQQRGYDGVAYKSAVTSSGKCYAFFDPKNFRCSQAQLHKVGKILVESERIVLSKIDLAYIKSKKEGK